MIYSILCLHRVFQLLSNQRVSERPEAVFPLADKYVNLGGLMVGCGAGEVLTVVHRATNSSVRRRGTSMVEYASIQGKV